MCVVLSDAISCPLEFIIFPLLTIIAGCMGINAPIAINQMWIEPAIVWFITKVKRKQQHFNCLRNPLKKLKRGTDMATDTNTEVQQ